MEEELTTENTPLTAKHAQYASRSLTSILIADAVRKCALIKSFIAKNKTERLADANGTATAGLCYVVAPVMVTGSLPLPRLAVVMRMRSRAHQELYAWTKCSTSPTTSNLRSFIICFTLSKLVKTNRLFSINVFLFFVFPGNFISA